MIKEKSSLARLIAIFFIDFNCIIVNYYHNKKYYGQLQELRGRYVMNKTSDTNTSEPRVPLTEFENSLRQQFLSAQSKDWIDSQYMIGFFYHPMGEMKVRLMNDDQDLEIAAFRRFSCDPEQTLLFVLDLKNGESFETQWRRDQLNFNPDYGAALIDDEIQLLESGIRIYTPRSREILRRHDARTSNTLHVIN